MTDERPLIDPNCLCGKPHPCPDHGRWVDTTPPPHQMEPTFPDHLTVAERQHMRATERRHAIDERTEWLLTKEIAEYDRRHNTHNDADEEVA